MKIRATDLRYVRKGDAMQDVRTRETFRVRKVRRNLHLYPNRWYWRCWAWFRWDMGWGVRCFAARLFRRRGRHVR